MRISCLVDRVSRMTTVVVLLCLRMPLYIILLPVSMHHLEHNPWYMRPALNVITTLIMDEMVMIIFAVSNIPTKLNISHMLHYGTLWRTL